MLNGFKVITLCGSTKFETKFKEIAKELTLEGYIVLTPHIYSHTNKMIINDQINELLLNIQKAKIDMSDSILVLNVDNYIGENTKKEINYAIAKGKEVKFLIN